MMKPFSSVLLKRVTVGAASRLESTMMILTQWSTLAECKNTTRAFEDARSTEDVDKITSSIDTLAVVPYGLSPQNLCFPAAMTPAADAACATVWGASRGEFIDFALSTSDLPQCCTTRNRCDPFPMGTVWILVTVCLVILVLLFLSRDNCSQLQQPATDLLALALGVLIAP